MNVFYTNANPVLAAREHCKVHMRKMIVESCQLLSAAHHILDGDDAMTGIYKLTHVNHPSAVWVRKSPFNYQWVAECCVELCRMYMQDTGKQHKSHELAVMLMCNKPQKWQRARDCDIAGFSEPPVAAPDEFKAVAVFEGAAKAYQQYLVSKFNEWLSREKPIKVEFIEKPIWA